MKRGSRAAGVLLATALALAGCAKSAPTRFYVLTAVPAERTANPAAEVRSAVGIGPIELPDYLDRPQIVTRSGRNRLELAEFDHWAEPLEQALPRALAANLASRLPGHRVVRFPWGTQRVAYQVVVRVSRFENRSNGYAALEADWSVYRGDRQRELLLERRNRFDEAAPGQAPERTGYEARVAALSRVLAELAAAIARSLETVEGS